jgi:hypothetical protein
VIGSVPAAQQLAAADRASSGEAANPRANSAGPAAELEAVRRTGDQRYLMGKRRRNRKPKRVPAEVIQAFSEAVPNGEFRRYSASATPAGIPVAGRTCNAVVLAASTVSSSAVLGLQPGQAPAGPVFLWRGFRQSTGASSGRKVDDAIYYISQDGSGWSIHSKLSPDHHRNIMSSSGLAGFLNDHSLPVASAGTLAQYREAGGTLTFETPFSPFGTS